MPHNYATELGSYLKQTSVSRAITTISIDVYISKRCSTNVPSEKVIIF